MLRAFMLSCPQRADACARTIERLVATDWAEPPELVLDETDCPRRQERQERTARQMLERALDAAGGEDVLLLLEDDLAFNRHLRHNLEHWRPLRELAAGEPLFGSLYNPGLGGRPVDPTGHCVEVSSGAVYGSQAFVVSPPTARYVLDHWGEVVGMQDIKLSRLAAQLAPIYYHRPSLVQHVGATSTWGGQHHVALDFDDGWRAPSPGSRARTAPRPHTGKALVTAGAGAYAELLALSRPSFEAYAARHGYDLIVGTGEEANGRPTPWAKVALLRRALAQYELALWLDADAVVVDPRRDIAELLEPWSFQALVEHHTPQGLCPNTGVWLLRAGAEASAFLDQVWEMRSLVNHPWWENAAVCAALGYELEPPCRRTRYTRFAEGTQWLPGEWNSIPTDAAEHAHIAHFPGATIEARLEKMRLLARADPDQEEHGGRSGTRFALALERMRDVRGWLDEDEARVLFNSAVRVGGGTIVEIGSAWGRSTVVLGTAAEDLGGHVYAVDPHEGVVSSVEGGTMRIEPTWESFAQTMAATRLDRVVTPIRAHSFDTEWARPIDLLFVDGLHDYASVARDTGHFLPRVRSGGVVAFHDYGVHFPGVKAFVDDLLTRRPDATLADAAGSLVALQCMP